MSERDRGIAIAMLAEAFRVKDLTPAQIRIYEKHLQAVPSEVLEPMTQRVIATRKPKWGELPPVAHLLEDAEACRREMLKALGECGCAQCEDSRGWIAVTHPDGVRMERCRCWRRLQERREQLALGSESLALAPAREMGE